MVDPWGAPCTSQRMSSLRIGSNRPRLGRALRHRQGVARRKGRNRRNCAGREEALTTWCYLSRMQTLITARILLTTAIVATLALPGHALVSAQAPAAQSSTRTERTVWYFYRVKWGFQDEFVRLFRKNHYPVLKEEMKSGRIKDVRTFVPIPRRRTGRLDLRGRDRLPRYGRDDRSVKRRGNREATLSRRGGVCTGGAEAFRDPRRALGRPAERDGHGRARDQIREGKSDKG